MVAVSEYKVTGGKEWNFQKYIYENLVYNKNGISNHWGQQFDKCYWVNS